MLRLSSAKFVFSFFRQFQRNVQKFLHTDLKSIVSCPLNLIHGEKAVSTGEKVLNITEKATGNVVGQWKTASEADVARAVESSQSAYAVWSQLSGSERGRCLTQAGQVIRKHLEEISRVEVHDTGKSIMEARLDVLSVAESLEYFAGLASNVNGDLIPLARGSFAYTRREPLGVCVGIGAWNFPIQIAAWKSAPCLAAGNAMVFKPSPLTPLSAVVLGDVYVEAGLPRGVFNVVQGDGPTGEHLIDHPDVAKVSFTGSIPTGQRIMAQCAKGIKKVTLELGGKSPLIIFDDASLDDAVNGALLANFMSQGQVCSNGTRVFVHRSVLTAFLDAIVARVNKLPIGDPMNEATRVGATISEEHAQKVVAYVDSARAEGARVLCGGERVAMKEKRLRNGVYVSPCVISESKDTMRFVREEIFGAVMAVLPFDTEDEVVRRANGTSFGLSAGVFTRDVQRAHRMAAALQAGNVWINNYNLVPPEIPFGGYKMSGLGRENGRTALEHYTQIKTVYVEGGKVDCPL